MSAIGGVVGDMVDHDGFVADLVTFFEGKLFNSYTATEKLDMAAYVVCFDTGTAPAVGYTRTLTKSTLASGLSDWNTLQAQASAGNIDLIVRGTVTGVVHGLLYNPVSNNYKLDTGNTVTQTQLEGLIQAGDVMSVMGVYPGTGAADETGRGAAQGTKLNLPMAPGSDDAAFARVWPQVTAHLERFAPEFIILQCGADSVEGDPITHLRFSAKTHGFAARELMALADRLGHGRVLALGGGGYNRANIAQAWTAVVENLL